MAVANSLTLTEAAREAGVRPQTLKRWAETGVIPEHDGHRDGWTPAAVAHARIVSRLRERGHSLQQIRQAGADGRLAYAFLEELFPDTGERYSLSDAASETGLAEALLERMWLSVGFPRSDLESIS